MPSLLALIALFAVLLDAPANAAPPSDEGTAVPTAPEEPSAPEVTEPKGDDLRQRATRIRALIEGTLDPRIDPSSLFLIDLADPAVVGATGERLLALLRALEAPSPPEPDAAPKRAVKPPKPPKPTSSDPPEAPDAATELTLALEAYLRLSPDERRAVLDRHAQRQAAEIAEREASSRREARLRAVTERADRLEAFLDGTLDVAIDPAPLLTLDLADEHESALSPTRRRTWPEPPAASPDEPAPEEPAPEEPAPEEPSKEPTPEEPAAEPDALARAEARLDALRRRFLALSETEQAALFELHTRRVQQAEQAEAEAEAKAEAEAQSKAEAEAQKAKLDVEATVEISNAEAEAEQAAADRAKALEDARVARTEAKRILARERARLLQIKEDQALLSAELNRRKAERIDNHERVLEWRQRVTGLLEGPLFGSDLETEADRMYDDIRSELATLRSLLRQEMQRIREPGAGLPVVGTGLDSELPADIDRGDLLSLHQELLSNEVELVALEQEVAWELAQGLRDDVVLLNRTRLKLLDVASPGLHGRVTGFGDEGVDQIRRELDQISVELGFHLLKLPRYGDILMRQLRGSPVTVAVRVLQLLLVLLGLWWWRKSWPGLLRRVRMWLVKRRPLPTAASWALTGLWYLDRVRRPLELLLTLWLVLSRLGDLDDLPELMLLWIIVRWILIGLAVILLVDAVAARDTLGRPTEGDSSPLRIHSLRVVGFNVIAVGLLLSLTSALVGRGAIYSWVLSTCWLLSVPVALYLVHRWRPIITERLAQRPEQGPFITWVRAQQSGAMSFVAAAAAAGLLLGQGLGRWFMTHLGGLETTRRVLAYLFRREVTRRAAAAKAESKSLERVGPACYSIFDPGHYEVRLIESIGQAEVDKVAALVEEPRSTLSAVIGERGMGKTSLLRRLEKRLGADRIKVISCPEVGLPALMLRIAAITGDQDRLGTELAEALREMGPMCIAIDDAQRLIQPAVFGLRELDQLTAFAREVGGEISWVITMGSAAWHYLQRARGDRVFFEQVIKLPRWSETQLGELIRSRCAEADIDPSFEGLVVPRPADAISSPGAPDDHRTEAGYHRLLWDYSRGNPAVALHAFRESLFLDSNDKVLVRLFDEPSAKEIEELSLPLLFVLRAVVQLELAREHELVSATHLPEVDVSDALRFCLTRGYVEHYDAGVRLSWPWLRTITNVLQRQHLLSAP